MARRSLRFGVASSTDGPTVQWLLKRNCSATPRQVMAFYASLCLLSAAISGFFWLQGATLVMPFASLEVVAVGAALLIHARHAGDNESIRLQPGRLMVERVSGPHVERAEFSPAWVRVEPERGERSLIELTGHGRRIAVGRFLRPELRRHLADELRWAVRHGQVATHGSASAAASVQDETEN